MTPWSRTVAEKQPVGSISADPVFGEEHFPLERLQIAANRLQSFLGHSVRPHATLSLRNTATPLNISTRYADIARSFREALPKLNDPSIRVWILIPDGMARKDINTMKEQIARILEVDSAFVEVREGTDGASIELMQDLQSKSDPGQPIGTLASDVGPR